MEGITRGIRWKNLRERLGFKGSGGCCGSSWVFGGNQMNAREEEEDGQIMVVDGNPPDNGAIRTETECVGQIPATGMNLATALAAELYFRAAQQDRDGTAPPRVSLFRLLEGEGNGERGDEGYGMCCVCMGRKKGAAFIPCGHTFCRVCSRELLLNRGSCPLCNRSILEILDIF